MPHSSASGMPRAWKKTITSRGVGAAPALTATTWSRPSIARTCAPSRRAAAAAASAVGHRLPRLLELDLLLGGVEALAVVRAGR